METNDNLFKELFEKSTLLASELTDAVPEGTQTVVVGLATSQMSAVCAIEVDMPLEIYLLSCKYAYEWMKEK